MRSLLLVALPFLSSPERTLAFRPDGRATTCRRYVEGVSVSAIASASVTTSHGDDASAAVKSRSGPSPSGECYYRRVDGPWRPRKELRDLKIGERLFASRIPSSDLLNGKTGPKVFFECGVGRKGRNNWSICNGMLRLGRRGMKSSVVRKKLKKLPPGELLEVYVSRVRPDHGSFEVCLKREQALEQGAEEGRRVSATTLRPGQKLAGTVKNVTPYGCFVDVGANRNGLLHITRVASRYGEYVNKVDGLEEKGLKRGLPVSVVVVNNERKRLELDLAPAEEAEEEEEEEKEEEDETASSTSGSVVASYSDISEDEAAAWAAYGSPSVVDDEEAAWAAYDAGEDDLGGDPAAEEDAAMWAAYNQPETNEDSSYDEDAEIEDSLGIGSY
mmetsp:Transcript_37073/g.88719  ORF Transcript_37073/g.88719 Transcript_37073/m.88719 type:complete len:387 (+) Transcript_37073:84-1244(+)